ncbi:MAG: M14 family metallopeptidase, partial [bacterium]
MEYYVKFRKKMDRIDPKHYVWAKKIDKNGDGILEYKEIKDILTSPLIKEDLILRRGFIRFVQHYLAGRLDEKKKFIRDYEEMVNSMKELAAKYPDKVSLEVIGKTFEGRDLIVMKINTNKDNPNKKSLLVTGLHHAREWATGEAAINIAEKLLQDYPNNEEVKNLLDNTDLYIFPVVNPDGYEYSLKKSA